MLSNILDGHPELNVYPTDITLLYAYFPMFHEDPGLKAESKRERACHVATNSLSTIVHRNKLADLIDVNKFSDAYSNKIKRVRPNDISTMIRCLPESLHESTTDESISALQEKAKSLVLKETSIEIYASDINAWFPNSRFIHILRDPRDNFAALKSGVSKHYASLGESESHTLMSMIDRAKLGFKFARLNFSKFGSDRYKVLKFEDLVENPKIETQGICDYLDISLDDQLLRPTVLGQPTGGNNYDGRVTFNIDKGNAGRWRDRISDYEAKVIEFHFKNEMDLCGYTRVYDEYAAADAASEFYKWSNTKYFFSDPFK